MRPKLKAKPPNHTGRLFCSLGSLGRLHKVPGLAIHSSRLLAFLGTKKRPWSEFPETVLCYVNKPVLQQSGGGGTFYWRALFSGQRSRKKGSYLSILFCNNYSLCFVSIVFFSPRSRALSSGEGLFHSRKQEAKIHSKTKRNQTKTRT